MKKTIIAAMAIATLVASGSAMASESMMSNDSMMMTNTAMMKKEGVMVGEAMANKEPMTNSGMVRRMMNGTVSSIAAHYGYNWKRDRASLAAQLGITNYRGTVSQNLQIRAHLFEMDTMMMQK